MCQPNLYITTSSERKCPHRTTELNKSKKVFSLYKEFLSVIKSHKENEIVEVLIGDMEMDLELGLSFTHFVAL